MKFSDKRIWLGAALAFGFLFAGNCAEAAMTAVEQEKAVAEICARLDERIPEIIDEHFEELEKGQDEDTAKALDGLKKESVEKEKASEKK